MRSFTAIFIGVGISCLLGVSKVSGKKDYIPRSAVHEMRDAIHQVGYNYPIWPSPSYGAAVAQPTSQSTAAPQKHDEVTTLDRFYRVSPDGTVEFKVSLSDGQINHQKIYTKIVKGKGIQVHDGYYSMRLDDGLFRTTYYRADELGYRLLGYNVDTVPPVELRIPENEMKQV